MEYYIETPNGLYEWVMPFGHCNAPSTYIHIITEVLEPFLKKFVDVYFGTMLICNRPKEEHLIHLRQVTEFSQVGALCKHKKCSFLCKKIMVLGFLVSANGWTPNPRKVLATKTRGTLEISMDRLRFSGDSFGISALL